MKIFLKVAIPFLLIFSPNTHAQDKEFFAGKWEILIMGSPRGDVKFQTELVRIEGKLTGVLTEMVEPGEPEKEKRAITRVEETNDKITIFFDNAQVGELSIELIKESENTLKGKLMSYDAIATRLR